jgi:hypothetical protein
MNNLNQKKKGIYIPKNGNNGILQHLKNKNASNVNVSLSTQHNHYHPQNLLVDDDSCGFTLNIPGSWISIILSKHKAKLSGYLLRSECSTYWQK